MKPFHRYFARYGQRWVVPRGLLWPDCPNLAKSRLFFHKAHREPSTHREHPKWGLIDGGICRINRHFMRHTLSVLVENKFGVLTRISGLFSGRGYNIDSLNVAPTQDPTQSRMTIVVKGDDTVLEQVTKQLNKLVDVIKVQDFRDGECVDRELVLIKVGADNKTRAEIMQICDIFRAKIVDVAHKALTIEITGDESKVGAFLDLMEPFGLRDISRTGKVAMPRK